jgi:hypothetical protein
MVVGVDRGAMHRARGMTTAELNNGQIGRVVTAVCLRLRCGWFWWGGNGRQKSASAACRKRLQRRRNASRRECVQSVTVV